MTVGSAPVLASGTALPHPQSRLSPVGCYPARTLTSWYPFLPPFYSLWGFLTTVSAEPPTVPAYSGPSLPLANPYSKCLLLSLFPAMASGGCLVRAFLGRVRAFQEDSPPHGDSLEGPSPPAFHLAPEWYTVQTTSVTNGVY